MSRRNKANSTLRLFGEARTVEDHFNEAERVLDRIDPFLAEVSLSLRSVVDRVPRATPTGLVVRSVIDDFREFDIYRRQFDSGDGLAILRAMAAAFRHSLPPPAWAVDAFLQTFSRYGDPSKRAPSLDELFTDGATAAARARQSHDWRLGVELWGAVMQHLAANKTASFSSALKVVMAQRRWGVGLTKARELVEAVERVQRSVLPSPALASYGRQVISRKRPRKRIA